MMEEPQTQKIMQPSPVKIVKIDKKEQTLRTIYFLREHNKMSYGNIAEKCGLDKALIWQIQKKGYWPQSEDKQDEIYEKLHVLTNKSEEDNQNVNE